MGGLAAWYERLDFVVGETSANALPKFELVMGDWSHWTLFGCDWGELLSVIWSCEMERLELLVI